MLNYIWFAMLVTGFVVGMLNGMLEAVTAAVVDSAVKAVEFGIGLSGIICLWTGMMKIAEKSGLVKGLSKLARPLFRALFPEVPFDHPAMGAIVMNLAANFLGLGNAATPFGLKAMQELQKLNRFRDTASDAMCMFLILNTTAVQLIPATIIAVRHAAGSQSPSDVIGAIWFSSVCAFVTGVVAVKLYTGILKGGRGRLWH